LALNIDKYRNNSLNIFQIIFLKMFNSILKK